MTYQFMKVLVLNNVKYQYFFNVVAVPSIDSNNLKLFKIAVLEFIRNKQSV